MTTEQHTTSTVSEGWDYALRLTWTPETRIIDDRGMDWTWAYVIYRQIPDYPDYWCGSDASVWSRLYVRWMYNHGGSWHRRKACISTNTYLMVSFRVTMPDGSRKIKTITLHRLIASTFLGSSPFGPRSDCRHLNGNKKDCRLVNLSWGTRSDNERDKVGHGRSNHGERNGQAKLTEDDIREIRRLIALGWSNTKLGQFFGVNQSLISRVRTGKYWAHIT